jgi:hypothetical protein
MHTQQRAKLTVSVVSGFLFVVREYVRLFAELVRDWLRQVVVLQSPVQDHKDLDVDRPVFGVLDKALQHFHESLAGRDLGVRAFKSRHQI